MGNTWRNRLAKWNLKLQRYMQGRYGIFDRLSKGLLVISLVLFLANMFFNMNLLRWGAFLVLAVVYYRFFSKKIYNRVNENQKFSNWVTKIKKRINYWKERFQNRKVYTYFACPTCKQQLRAPKNKGTIKVTCSSCKNQFTKKV